MNLPDDDELMTTLSVCAEVKPLSSTEHLSAIMGVLL